MFDNSQVQQNFNWLLEINGFDQGMAQEITPPKKEIGEAPVGSATNSNDLMIPLKPKVGLLMLSKVKSKLGGDNFFHNLLEEAAAGRYSQARFRLFLHLVDENSAIIESYDAGISWIKSIEMDKLVRKEGDGAVLMEKVEIRPYDWVKVAI